MWWRRRKDELPLIMLIQGSLQPQTLTDAVCEEAARILAGYAVTVVPIDVRKGDGGFYHTHTSPVSTKDIQASHELFKRAKGCLIVMPVYSATAAGAVKDLMVRAGTTVQGKVAGLACIGKKDALYPASVDLLNMLYDRCGMTVVKPLVLASPESFRSGRLFDEQVAAIMQEMIAAFVHKILE